MPLRVREYQGSVFSCLEALPQALAAGSCVAVGLLLRGLRAEDVIVPVDVATGKNVQFWRHLCCWRADPHEHSYEQGAGPVGSRRRAAG